MNIKLTALFLVNALAVFAQSGKETITREIPWDGSEALTLDVPAEVRFVQTPGPGKVVVTGPRRSVETFEVAGGVLRDRTLRTGRQLRIIVQAPKVTRFSVKGGDKLVIEAFDQDELKIEATGRADIKATGRTETIRLNLRGFGWADLSQVQAKGAEITLSGSRKAIIAPELWAKLSGNGSVVLLTRPEKVTQELWGAGRVIHAYPTIAVSPLSAHRASMVDPLVSLRAE